MSLETMTRVLEVMLVVLCVITTAFPTFYGLRNRFWETRAGLGTFLVTSGLAAAWDLTAFLHFWPGEFSITTYFWVQFAVMLYTICAGSYLLYALWYNQRHGQMVTVRPKEECKDGRSTE